MIELKGSKNYAASVVVINKVEPIPKYDRIQIARIFGNSIIVSKDVKPGDMMIYFPVGCSLSKEFLSNNNAYRKAEHGNKDENAKGFFDQNGLVRCLKLAGTKSEGVLFPLSSLDWAVDGIFTVDGFGEDFDTVNGKEICRKYVPRCNPVSTKHGFKERKARPEDMILDGQFRFHYDTENLRRNIHRINPADIIAVTWKMHGTSIVLANLLVNKKLTWKEKVAKWLGIPVIEADYGLVWSSRKVVKGVDSESKKDAVHFYDTDVWGDWAKQIGVLIPKGYTIYAEVVGYTSNGTPIQKYDRDNHYDYGCPVGKSELYVYRITQTNADGNVVEMPYPQMQAWCEENGLETVPHIYYGTMGDWLSGEYCAYEDELADAVSELRDRPAELSHEEAIQNLFLQELEKKYIKDQDSNFCNHTVPEEGIVVRVEKGLRCEAYKLKSFRFLEGESKQLDLGVADMETEQSEGGE